MNFFFRNPFKSRMDFFRIKTSKTCYSGSPAAFIEKVGGEAGGALSW